MKMIQVYLLLIALCRSCGEAAELRGSSSAFSVESVQHGSSDSLHPRSRRERFPSLQERVQIYMSNWYSPPCHDSDRHLFTLENDNVLVHNMTISPRIEPDTLFQLKEDIVHQCTKSKQELASEAEQNQTSLLEEYIDSKPQSRGNMGMYCADVTEIFTILHFLPQEQQQDVIPILMQFGDMKHSHDFGYVSIPHFKKFRSATDNLQSVISNECVTNPRTALQTAHEQQDEILQPIVWKLATHRHFKHLPDVNKYDTPWNLKKDMAIFRGQLTGALEHFDKKISPQENCNNMLRCHLVQRHGNSTLVDAKLTTTRNRLPNVLGGVELVGPKVPIRYMMEYKGLVMLEGNDVASGLKWALLSQSVVLMSKPRHTSWAMEERLQPWVHYVPLNDQATDVEEKMQWIIDHDEEAQRIAQRASLWMEDLVFHPDAARDDRLVKEEMLKRYRAHFVKAANGES